MMPINLNGNNFEAKWRLTRANTTTGIEEPDAGHGGLNVRYSATPKGAAIDASLSKAVSERAGTPGDYFAIVLGSDIETYLRPYKNKTVYEILSDAAGTVFAMTPRLVVDERRIQ